MATDPTTGASMRRHAVLALSLALALVLVLLVAIFVRQGTFSRSATLYFIAESANGLSPGTAVKLSGFRIGAVSDLQLESDLSVKVTLKIALNDFLRLRSDARAELKKEDVVQTAAIEVSAGKGPESLSSTDPRIVFDRSRSFGQKAQDLMDRLAPILEDVKTLTGLLIDRDRGLGPMLTQARAVSHDLAIAAAEIRVLAIETRARFAAVGVQAQGTLGDASAAFARLDRMAGKAEQSLGTLGDALPGLLVKINGTLDTAQEVVLDARTVSTAASESVPRTLRDIQPVIEDARLIVRGVKQSWPIRNLIPASTPASLPGDEQGANLPHNRSAR